MTEHTTGRVQLDKAAGDLRLAGPLLEGGQNVSARQTSEAVRMAVWPRIPKRSSKAGASRVPEVEPKGETGPEAVGPEDPVGGHHVVGVMGDGVRHADRKGGDDIG